VAEWFEDLAVAILKLGATTMWPGRASLRAVYFRLHRLMARGALAKSGAPDAGHALDSRKARATSSCHGCWNSRRCVMRRNTDSTTQSLHSNRLVQIDLLTPLPLRENSHSANQTLPRS
jgi:hypothetical protein